MNRRGFLTVLQRLGATPSGEVHLCKTELGNYAIKQGESVTVCGDKDDAMMYARRVLAAEKLA